MAGGAVNGTVLLTLGQDIYFGLQPVSASARLG